VARRQKRLEDAQAQVAELTKLLAKASGSRKDVLQDQLEGAQAWEDVAQNALDDAKIDLQRAGGDKHAQIQQMEEEHSASEHEGAPGNNAAGGKPVAPVESTPAVSAHSRGLLAQYQQWSGLRAKRNRLLEAQREAQAALVLLKQEHDDLAERVKTSTGETPAPGEGPAAPANKEEAAAIRAHTKHLTSQQKKLLGLNRRARLEEELAGVYVQWGALVAGQTRTALHGVLLSVAVVLLIALVVLAVDGWLARFFSGLGPERTRILTVRRVARVGLQTVSVVLILLIVFGPPGQLAVLLGFAGAGLTIALKDFIVGFFGWFVLMGKDGIRVGDWVEIKGVTGEVVDIGPLHTVLLETGNWTDAGHPTGRRVTFVNSFAIEGHYFNFSTSGQWLWDEVVATLPPGHDPYPVVDAIQKIVAKETEEMTRLAELEWTKAGRSRGLSGFSAAPAITVRPGVAGFDVVARYVTRANERHALRARLYQALVELLGGRRAAAGA
jgi:small-conductance mechanosensitive channel